MRRLLLGLAGPDSPGHAVPEGTLEALCGAVVEATISQPFPAGASHLCRYCQAADAWAGSRMPQPASPRHRRSGGMA